MNTPSLAAALLLAVAASPAAAEASRFEPDCVHVVFQPEDPPVSKPMTLTSLEWVTTCVPAGSTAESCWELPGAGVSLPVTLTLADRRPLLPWESDVFQVCLTGPALDVEPVSTAYDYRVASDGARDGNVVLASGAKRALPPDPRGVQGALTPELTLVLRDRWAAYYPGEELVLTVALKKEETFFPDDTVVEKEITLPVAEGYSLDLGGAAREPGIYYAEYSIKRLGGAVSTEERTRELVTGKVSFGPE